ncbi:MAG: peptidoglycan -binding protein [Hyphomicrobiaceae bacterium]
MALARTRRGSTASDYWPGFVDAMATLLLVMTFLLSIFMIAQYFVTQESSGKDSALARLTRQIAQLTELLSLEQGQTKSLKEELAALTATLATTESENKRLAGVIDLGNEKAGSAEGRAAALTSQLDEQKEISSEALAQVEILNQQMLALRRQIASLQSALEESEQKASESETRIEDLGKRLNIALARKVQELSRYRSDFFGRLREILGNRDDVKIVGDRFVFESEVLFPSGSAELTGEGLQALGPLARAIRQLSTKIPDDIDWILRIDGHTDRRPISSAEFPSNWELSFSRALSVLRLFNAEGVESKRLVAAGFGEFRPIDEGSSAEALQRNRRIELKLTTR